MHFIFWILGLRVLLGTWFRDGLYWFCLVFKISLKRMAIKYIGYRCEIGSICLDKLARLITALKLAGTSLSLSSFLVVSSKVSYPEFKPHHTQKGLDQQSTQHEKCIYIYILEKKKFTIQIPPNVISLELRLLNNVV